MFTLTTAQGLWMRIFAKRVVKPNHVFSNFFFLLFSESESARAKNSPQIKRFFFFGGGGLLFYGHYHSMLKVAT